MAANPAFKKMIVRDITLDYPRLDATYRFNSQEQKSEKCSQTAQGAAWSISWRMSNDEARKFYDELQAHYIECKKRDTTLPVFSKLFGMKKLDDGQVSFRAKKNGTNSQGEPNQPPIVIGGDKQPLADKAIWSGSKGTLRVIAFPSKSPQGEGGISLLLDAVQVTEPVYGGDGLDDFEIIDSASVSAPADDPFSPSGGHQQSAGGFDLGGDDIPF